MEKTEKFLQFLKDYPYYENERLDAIREKFFPLLKDCVYADWTGAAPKPSSLIDSDADFQKKHLIGNPHSHHAPSALAMELAEEARTQVLYFFNADPDEYDVIFTANATGAILLLHNYMFEGGDLLLTADNHNSVNGLRETAKRHGAIVRYSPIDNDLQIIGSELERALSYPRATHNKLFCYPAKSNYSGVLHSLEWVSIAQEKGWDVLLDAAAYSANNRLDLHFVQPDFVPISFYKIFGYPTGIGCLIIKKEKYEKLNKSFFSGGSILLVSVMKDFFAPETIGHARYEDGTINFAAMQPIVRGFEFMTSLGKYTWRVKAITDWLRKALLAMNTEKNFIIVHSPIGSDTVTFSITDESGCHILDAWEFEQFANEHNVYVRTGCFCNPGVNEKLFGYEIDTYEKFYNDAILPSQITIENLRKYSGDKPIGAIRASFGYANNFSDVERFAEVVKMFIEQL
jgi:selenocysteine lyase/cysteine desulfurase